MSEIQSEDAIGANRVLWDAWTRVHRSSDFYDVPGFLSGRDPLNRIETSELGGVEGKRLLHLQCHFGIDTLGWARRGARVTGVDWPYLATGEPIEIESEASYVGPVDEGPLAEYNWPHGIGEVVTSLVEAGLRIEWLREHPRSPYPFPDFLERRPDGDYGWPGGRDDIPLIFSIGARR